MEIWYYVDAGGERQGPVSAEQIKLFYQRREITRETHVWCDGMFAWMPVGALARQFKLDEEAEPAQQAPANPYARPSSAPRSGGSTYMPPVPNNLVWAILSTLLCCWPLGVVSIVYAVRVDRYRAEGSLEAAREASSAAGMWAVWSAAITLVLVVLILFFDMAFGTKL